MKGHHFIEQQRASGVEPGLWSAPWSAPVRIAEGEGHAWGPGSGGDSSRALAKGPATHDDGVTMSLWLSLRARTALALDTLACAITSPSGPAAPVLPRPPGVGYAGR